MRIHYGAVMLVQKITKRIRMTRCCKDYELVTFIKTANEWYIDSGGVVACSRPACQPASNYYYLPFCRLLWSVQVGKKIDFALQKYNNLCLRIVWSVTTQRNHGQQLSPCAATRLATSHRWIRINTHHLTNAENGKNKKEDKRQSSFWIAANMQFPISLSGWK